jgi:hypothetical protein
MKFELSYADMQKRLEQDTGRPVQLSWLQGAKRDVRLKENLHWIKDGDLKSSPVWWSEEGYEVLLGIRREGLLKANISLGKQEKRPPKFD